MSFPTSAVKSHAPLIRLVLYFLLGLWSLFLFIFCAVRLAYTSTPRSEKSLMDGLPFYDPSVVELLISSVFGFGFSIFMFTTIRSRKESEYSSRNWFEVSFLFLLWMLWLGGAGAASNVWPDLSWCIAFSPCQVLQALMGWAWLGWLCVTFLFIPTLWVVAAARNWDDNFFDTWGSDHSADVHTSGGNRRIPDAGPDSEGSHEKSVKSQVELEVQAREQDWNLEKEAAKIRARLNSWMGHRRQSREARAAAGVDLERGRPHVDSGEAHRSLPPLPPLPNGALRLNVGDVAPMVP